MTIGENANSLSVLDEVIEGHRGDIEATKNKMLELRQQLGWVCKVPGSGYDALLSELKRSTIQLEALLLFRVAFLEAVGRKPANSMLY